jgi:hypothetical protein
MNDPKVRAALYARVSTWGSCQRLLAGGHCLQCARRDLPHEAQLQAFTTDGA